MSEPNWEYADLIVKIRRGVMYVAVIGATGDWEAYVGNRNLGIMAVKAGGDLLAEISARPIFPELDGMFYRSP